MVIWSAFHMGQYRVNDHPYYAPQFRYDSFLPFILALRFSRLDIDAKYTFALFRDSMTANVIGTYPCPLSVNPYRVLPTMFPDIGQFL